jgi:hypothetical protein
MMWQEKHTTIKYYSRKTYERWRIVQNLENSRGVNSLLEEMFTISHTPKTGDIQALLHLDSHLSTACQKLVLANIKSPIN